MKDTLLTLKDFVVGYSKHQLTSKISVQIPKGVRVGIIGANGSGKSTFVKTLLGFVAPLSGQSTWCSPIRFGYVPQENHLDTLFPLTVEDLLKMGSLGTLSRWLSLSDDFEKNCDRVLNELEMTDLRNCLVRELSGGQRQRALIARALMTHPDVLILDEPYSFLDHLFHKKLQNRFQEWSDQQGLSLFLVEHDLNLMLNQMTSQDWLIILGRQKTLCGPMAQVLTEKALSEAYGAEVHLHEEEGRLQVHVL